MAEAKIIYILHGWALSSENEQKWQAFISALNTQGFETIFLRIPGLSAPLDEVWQLDNFVEWLASQLPKNKKSIVLGHSFGGQIAVRFAALYPNRIEKLILIDSAGIRDHSFVPTIKRKVFWLLAKMGKILLPYSWPRTLLYKLAREKDYHNAPPLLRRTMSTILDQEVVGNLHKVFCPVLLIWGEKDTVTPLKLGFIFQKNIKNNTLVVIKNARHSPQFTHHQETTQAVNAFLRN